MLSESNQVVPVGRELRLWALFNFLFGIVGLTLSVRSGSLLLIVMFVVATLIGLLKLARLKREDSIPISTLPLLPPDVPIESFVRTAVRAISMGWLFAACVAAGFFMTVIGTAAGGAALGFALAALAEEIRHQRVERHCHCRVFGDATWRAPLLDREPPSPRFYKVEVGESARATGQSA
jgi:hypothetical protein